MEAMTNTENHKNFKQQLKNVYKEENDVNTKIWLDVFDEVFDLKNLEKLYPHLSREEIISAYAYT